MSHISFPYSFGSMPLRNPGWLPIHSKRKSVLVWIKVWVKARMSMWTARYALVCQNKLPEIMGKFKNCHNVWVKPYCTTKHAPFSPPFHTNSHCLVAVVEVVFSVDANANPGRQTDSTYCPLYWEKTKNIISRHKRRCHGVHQCEPCLNIQFLPCTWGGSFDVYGRDFISWAEYQRKRWL